MGNTDVIAGVFRYAITTAAVASVRWGMVWFFTGYSARVLETHIAASASAAEQDAREATE
jgi:hypothetical protein